MTRGNLPLIRDYSNAFIPNTEVLRRIFGSFSITLPILTLPIQLTVEILANPATEFQLRAHCDLRQS